MEKNISFRNEPNSIVKLSENMLVYKANNTQGKLFWNIQTTLKTIEKDKLDEKKLFFKMLQDLQDFNNNLLHPISCQVYPSGSETKFIEIYERFDISLKSIYIEAIFAEILQTLIFLEEKGIPNITIYFNSLCFDENTKLYKFLVIPHKNTEFHQILEIFYKLLCLKSKKNCNSAILVSKIFKEKIEYEKFLDSEIIRKIQDLPINSDKIREILKYEIIKNLKLPMKTIGELYFGISELNSINIRILNKIAHKTNSVQKFITEIQKNNKTYKQTLDSLNYLILDCGHTILYNDFNNLIRFKIWTERKNINKMLFCKFCGVLVLPKKIYLQCGCIMNFNEINGKYIEKCNCNLKLTFEEFIYLNSIQKTIGNYDDKSILSFLYENGKGFTEIFNKMNEKHEFLDLLSFSDNFSLFFGGKDAIIKMTIKSLIYLNLSKIPFVEADLCRILPKIQQCKNLKLLDLSRISLKYENFIKKFSNFLESANLEILSLRIFSLDFTSKKMIVN